MRRTVGLTVSFGISAVLLVYLFRDVQWTLFFAELRRVRPGYLPLLVLLCIAPFWLRALRWRYLIPRGREISTGDLYNATAIGFFASFVLPLRAGEVVRPWALSRFAPVSFSSALASIVIERVFDVVALFLLLGLAMQHVAEAPELVIIGAQILGAMAGAIVVLMVVAYFRGPFVIRLSERLIRATVSVRWPELGTKLEGMALEFVNGLRGVGSFKDLSIVLALSLVLWLEVTVLYQCVMWSFGEFPSWWVGLTVNLMVALAVAAPAAPGFVGTFQLGCRIALTTMYGYSEEFALSYSIFAHVTQLVVVAALGFIALNRAGLGFGEMRRGGDAALVPGEAHS